MTRFGFSIFALVLFPAAVLAKPAAQADYAHFALTEKQVSARQSSAYASCLNKAEGNTFSLRECIGAEFQRIDRQLNARYKEAMRRLNGNARAKLRDEQRVWLKARLDTCERDLEDDKGGTIWLIEMDDCALQEHMRRTAWIETIRR